VTLADRLEAVLREHGPLPARALARELHKRDAEVFAVLHSDSRFLHRGKRRASRWDVRRVSIDAAEAASRWGCDPETAAEIIFGPDGLLERGFVASLNGNGRVVVTRIGLEAAAALEVLA
jgi:hypothetical protein